MVQRGLIAALVRELAMQSQWIDDPPATTARAGACASSASRCAAPRCATSCARPLRRCTAQPVELELLDGVPSDTPALREAAARARAQQQAEQTMTTDPVVRELMSQFKTARIVPGSIKPVQRNPSP